VDICQYCTELGVKVGLITNGSRTLRWWEDNKKYFDHVCISFHPEFAEEQHFIDVVKLLRDDVRTHVNIMMSPENFDYCYALANKVKNLGNISMALQPLIHDFGDTLFDYNEFQKKIFACLAVASKVEKPIIKLEEEKPAKNNKIRNNSKTITEKKKPVVKVQKEPLLQETGALKRVKA
jgi:hypothetical protein